MSTRRTSLLAIAALVVGLVAGGFVTSRFYQGHLNQFAADSAAAGVGSAYSALHRLRDGRTNDAIELLEIDLDGHMLALESMLEEVPQRGHNTNSVRLLERARAYRVAHPRERAAADTRERSQ